MTQPRSRYHTLLEREIHVTEWGEPGKPPLVMWHGLARTGRDFDDIAQTLARDWRIVVPDTMGRGLSQWSPRPADDYCYDVYARHAAALVDAYGFAQVDWIGTSMGGGVAIRAAAGPLAGRIRRLVLNDIGPEVPKAAIERIRAYAGKPPRFARMSELEAYFRQVYKSFGFLTDAQWRRLTETSMRRLPDGGVTTHYDPQMVMQFERNPPDNDQWVYWDRMACDVLCLRGADSDVLAPQTAEEMTRRGPRCRVVTIADCGHAPALNTPDQIALVADFLKG